MRRPGVRIPSRPPSFKTTSSVPNSSYRGTLGLISLPDSFRYLVIHPERHCLSATSSVNTSRLPGTYPHDAEPDYLRRYRSYHLAARRSDLILKIASSSIEREMRLLRSEPQHPFAWIRRPRDWRRRLRPCDCWHAWHTSARGPG